MKNILFLWCSPYATKGVKMVSGKAYLRERWAVVWVLLSVMALVRDKDVCQQPPGDQCSRSNSAAQAQPWKFQVTGLKYPKYSFWVSSGNEYKVTETVKFKKCLRHPDSELVSAISDLATREAQMLFTNGKFLRGTSQVTQCTSRWLQKKF